MNLLRSLIQTVLVALLISLPAVALAGPTLVFDVKTGEILHEDNAAASWHPASLTKMMTAHLALKAIKDGKLNLKSKVTFSSHAASQPPSKLGLKAGRSLILHDALKIMLTRSANDVATAIGETVAGTEAKFAEMMTLEAKALGMMATRFVNANGLDNPSQITTARDLALLTMAIHKQHPDYLYLFSIKEMRYGKKRLRNTNSLLRTYAGMNGMKTGYICASGFNIVTTTKVKGRTIGTIVLGESSGKVRTAKVRKVLGKALKSPSKKGLNVSSFGQRQESPAMDLRVKNLRSKGSAQARATDARFLSQGHPASGATAGRSAREGEKVLNGNGTARLNRT